MEAATATTPKKRNARKQVVSFVATTLLRDRLKRHCTDRGLCVAEVARRAIVDYLEKQTDLNA